MKLKLRLPNLPSFTLIWSQRAFCFQFHHLSLWVNAAIHWQYDLVYRVIPDLISGMVSSVACLVIADQFGKVCKTAKITFSLMCQLLFGVQNHCNDPLQKHAHQMLFTDKALPTIIIIIIICNSYIAPNPAWRAQSTSQFRTRMDIRIKTWNMHTPDDPTSTAKRRQTCTHPGTVSATQIRHRGQIWEEKVLPYSPKTMVYFGY